MIKKSLIFLLFFFINTFSFAEEFKTLQSGKIKFDTFYTFDYSRIKSEEYKNSLIEGKGNLFLPKNLDEKKKYH